MFGALKILLTILSLSPAVITMIKNIEEIVEGAKKGELKKKVVLNTIETALDTGAEFNPYIGEVKEPVVRAMDKLIDGIVYLFNTFGVFKKDVKLDVTPKSEQ